MGTRLSDDQKTLTGRMVKSKKEGFELLHKPEKPKPEPKFLDEIRKLDNWLYHRRITKYFKNPTIKLYHLTSASAVESIKEKGIRPSKTVCMRPLREVQPRERDEAVFAYDLETLKRIVKYGEEEDKIIEFEIELDKAFIGDLYLECTPKYLETVQKLSKHFKTPYKTRYREAEIFIPYMIPPEKITGVYDRKHFMQSNNPDSNPLRKIFITPKGKWFLCPECESDDVYYDERRDEYVCRKCATVFTPDAEDRVLTAALEEVEIEGSSSTRTLVKEETPEGGLRLILTQRQVFPKWRKVFNKELGRKEEVEAVYPFWNPLLNRMEDRPKQDIIYDASIPSEVYQRYKEISPRLKQDERVLLILGLLGESLSTSAIGDAVGMAHSTAKRVIPTMAGDDYLVKAPRGLGYGPTMVFEGEVYREGPINEAYRVLSERGFERYEKILEETITPYGARAREIAIRRGEPPPVTMKTVLSRRGLILAGKGGVIYEEPVREVDPLTREEVDWYVGFKEGRGAKRAWTVPREDWEEQKRRYREEERRKPPFRRTMWWLYKPYSKIVPYEEEPYPLMREEEVEKGIEIPEPPCKHPATFTAPTGEEICIVCGEVV